MIAEKSDSLDTKAKNATKVQNNTTLTKIWLLLQRKTSLECLREKMELIVSVTSAVHQFICSITDIHLNVFFSS